MICTAIEISYRKLISLVYGESIWVSAWTLMLQALLFTTFMFSFHFRMKTSVGITFVNTFLLLSEAISSWIASFVWVQFERVLFKLCHGHGLWIRIFIKVVCNHEKCMSAIVGFHLYDSHDCIKFWWNLVTLDDSSCFPIRLSLGFRCPSHCVHYWAGLWRFPSHWVYTTH